ncbi:DUF2239 family protein, partial [Dyella sp. ASV21]|uniref:DUF2239 family protein n=1 Tax=Dyella sp. ASV21 TaxID=2795114 RepID=UPI0018ED050C
EARRESVGRDRARLAGEALDRFMLTMAGDLPGYEEAARAFWRPVSYTHLTLPTTTFGCRSRWAPCH